MDTRYGQLIFARIEEEDVDYFEEEDVDYFRRKLVDHIANGKDITRVKLQYELVRNAFNERRANQLRAMKALPDDECEYNGQVRTIIPLHELQVDAVYKGECRNANYALWNGNRFIHLRTKFADTFLETIRHPNDEERYDVFLPECIADETDPNVKKLRTAIANISEHDRKYFYE